MGILFNIEIPSKTTLLQTPKKSNHHYYRPQKIEKISEKKLCEIFYIKKNRNFLRKCLENSSKGTRNN